MVKRYTCEAYKADAIQQRIAEREHADNAIEECRQIVRFDRAREQSRRDLRNALYAALALALLVGAVYYAERVAPSNPDTVEQAIAGH